jgi:hypothetical protein
MDVRFGAWNVRKLYKAGSLVVGKLERKRPIGRPRRRCEEKGKVPVLLTEHDATKAYWGTGGIASLIL